MNRRIGTWIHRLIVAAGVGIVAVIVLYVALLPIIVHAALRRALADLGATNATFHVERVSLRGIGLTNIELGQPQQWLLAREIRVNYSLGSLWNGRVQSVQVDRARWTVQVRDGRVDFGPALKPRPAPPGPVDLRLDHIALQQVTVIVDQDGQERRLTVQGTIDQATPGELLADLQIAAPQELVLSGANLTVAGVSGRLHLRADMAVGQARVHALEGSYFTVESLAAALPDNRALRVSALGIDLAKSGDEPLVRAVYEGQARGAWLNAQLRTTQPISLVTEGAAMDISVIAAAASIAAPAQQPIAVDARISVDRAAINLPSQQLALEGISATVPVSLNSAGAAPGAFTIGAVAWRGVNLPGLNGTVAITGRRVDATALWPILQGANLDAKASVNFSDENPQGQLIARIPAFELADLGPIREFFPSLRDVDVGGTFALDADVRLAQGKFQPLVVLTAQNARVSGEQWPAAIESFDASIAFNNFAPLATAPGQRLVINQAHAGQLPITRGTAVFTLERPDSLLIEKGEWDMGEYGQFRVSPLRFNPAKPEIQTTLACDRVGLGEWLPLLSNDRIKGEGQLTGHLKLSVRPTAPDRIEIAEGNLEAAADGWIQTADAELVARKVEQSNPEFKTDETLSDVKARIISALMDFRYSVLTVRFTPQPDGVECAIHTRGIGRRGPEPVEIGGLNFTVQDFNGLLNLALGMKSSLEPRE